MTRTTSFFLVIVLAAATSGCTVLQDYLGQARNEAAPVVVPLQQRERLAPLKQNYFVLDDIEQSVIGEPQVVFSRESDTFSDLAREYGLGYDEIVAANPHIDPWLPGENTPVLLPTQYVLPDVPKRGVVLNIASKRLFYFPAVGDGEQHIVMTYPIGIGRVGWETPLGKTTVVSKARDPHWYVPASVRKEHAEIGDPLPSIVAPGPDNPLGKYVLKLGLPGYLIHGTNQPYGVGMRVSHGCVRLYPENIELLYSLVDPGEPVQIINEPFLVGAVRGELYFESHTPLQDDAVSPDARLASLFTVHEAFADQRARNAAYALAAESTGVAVRVLLSDPKEVFARVRVIQNTVEPDPGAPTLAEVRAIMDEMDEDPVAAN